MHPPRLRLDGSISADRECRCHARLQCHDRWRGGFGRLHSREHDGHAFLWAFDLLELDGEDLRARPLLERKKALHRLLRRTKTGIRFNEHVEGDGAKVFAHACELGLEGIVSKDRMRPYGSGRVKRWLKIKNPQAPGVTRFEDHDAPA
jgi:ATP-dependent DNA ligase